MGNYVHRAAQGDALLYRGVSPLRHEGYEYSVPYSTPGPARRYAGKQGYVEVCHPTWRRLDADCTCPGGLPDGWKTDYDPDCPRHRVPEPTDEELRALLPAARAALYWCVGARTGVYADDSDGTDADGWLTNVIVAVLRELRTPDELRGLGA